MSWGPTRRPTVTRRVFPRLWPRTRQILTYPGGLSLVLKKGSIHGDIGFNYNRRCYALKASLDRAQGMEVSSYIGTNIINHIRICSCRIPYTGVCYLSKLEDVLSIEI